MSGNLSVEQLRVWEQLQDATEILRREVGRGLWSDAQLSDAEFTVLAHLAQSGGGRPTECARSIGWDSSRLAHQLRRLEKRGLVQSVPGDADRRSTRIALTEEGRSMHRCALGPHLRAAKKWFADALTNQQMVALGDALDALLAHAATLTEADASATLPGARQ
ncbi:MarR family transcriptional regulator [Leifsonia xyli subsp. xyli]|uniref:Transcriptional regulator, MarR family n=2 Tax=Leifsonia xyli subsp. xyli TaxID=59736 RepID=Q6AFM1_LEIXX|nr:MarR family transcriptional regulator [Leifsonia xyli]AAT88824.1 transcriptional regulator, MarR family [Leifsonia xyli subsp. xyli str. CTCB07]ODA89853.1 MarR family transcriptional regulator [Leifsonia xyli subsp. xyli]